MTMDQVLVRTPAQSPTTGRKFRLGLVADAPPEFDELDAQTRPRLSRTCCLAAIAFCVASWAAMIVGVMVLLR